MKTIAERFHEKYEVAESGCWLWTAHLDPQGYGRFHWARGDELSREQLAHRASLRLIGVSIEEMEGLTVDHLCRVSNCVNPAHLELVTLSENSKRSHNPPRPRRELLTHCKRGHEYTEENTYRSKGQRICRACNVIRQQRARAKREAVQA